jgi:hypothetical protein
MCTQIYLGADRPLPVTQAGPSCWEAAAGGPAFYLVATGEDPGRSAAERRARRQLRHPHVYYVGSHLGCGCGFGYIPPDGDEDDDTIAWHQACREATHYLAGYLAETTHDGPVELLVTWRDREDQVPTSRRSINPDYFRGEWVVLWPHTGELITVLPASAAPADEDRTES